MHVHYLASGFALTSVLLVSTVAWSAQGSLSDAGRTTKMADEPVLSLPQAVSIARQRSALVQSLAAKRSAAMALARSANNLPDPVISVGVNNWPISGTARFELDKQLPTAVAVGVSRKLTRRDKRDAKSQQFESQAALAEAE